MCTCILIYTDTYIHIWLIKLTIIVNIFFNLKYKSEYVSIKSRSFYACQGRSIHVKVVLYMSRGVYILCILKGMQIVLSYVWMQHISRHYECMLVYNSGYRLVLVMVVAFDCSLLACIVYVVERRYDRRRYGSSVQIKMSQSQWCINLLNMWGVNVGSTMMWFLYRPHVYDMSLDLLLMILLMTFQHS